MSGKIVDTCEKEKVVGVGVLLSMKGLSREWALRLNRGERAASELTKIKLYKKGYGNFLVSKIISNTTFTKREILVITILHCWAILLPEDMSY